MAATIGHMLATDARSKHPAIALLRRNAQLRASVIAAPIARAQAVAQGTKEVVLSTELRKTTAILNLPNPKSPSGETKVYILAMSHVSQVSCNQIRSLIRTVKPDVVMVELCKDRLGLLVTDFPPGPRVWHSRRIVISGVPEASGFPTEEELKSLLICKPGTPVTTEDIESDVRALQATGLFRTIRPSVLNASNTDAPMFVVAGDENDPSGVGIATVPPFNQIEFRAQLRTLPPVMSVSIRVNSAAAEAGVTISKKKRKEITTATLADATAEGSKSVKVLMAMRERLCSAAVGGGGNVDVSFRNVENGDVEAVVVLRGDGDGVQSGLERSAEGGEGFGIEPFQNPNRGDDVKVGLTSRIPADAVEKIAQSQAVKIKATSGETEEEVSGAGEAVALGAGAAAATQRAVRRTKWRRWNWKELATAADEDPQAQPLKDLLADTLSALYGQLQARACDTVSIKGGEAWRVALEEGVRCGASQVLLGDRPAFVTQRRLAQGMWGGLAPPIIASLVALNASVLAATFGLVTSEVNGAVIAGSAAVALIALLPIGLPFIEMGRFSLMSAEEIEAAVAVPDDVQGNLGERLKLWGEDALLDWPGAEESLIQERDDYMARTLAAAALGKDGQVPAFVMDEVEGKPVMRYMMADGASNKAAPTGGGDGAYQPLEDAEAVVAVVGSAHVRGICNAWEKAAQDVRVEKLLRS